MLNRVDKNEKRQKRHLRSRQYIIGTAEKPRLNVYRSLSNIYAQVINDVTGETIVAASTVEKDLKANYGGNTEAHSKRSQPFWFYFPSPLVNPASFG